MKPSDSQGPIPACYAEQPRWKALHSGALNIRRGIIRGSALCVLCRYRHNTHWSEHSCHLSCEFGARFGDDAYVFEELDAEISSAFLNAELVFVDATMENHASYIDSRLAVLKRDKMVIVSAATRWLPRRTGSLWV